MARRMLESWPNFGYQAYALALPALWGIFATHRWFKERHAAGRHSQNIADGSTEPVSLHPHINPALCVGCGACTHACPEGDIIGMIGEKAHLLDPASCIGHGACKTACPVGAIELVFGSARRGVDIPIVTPSFESNVPGLFIAGELGGMGLIANAIEQGRQAIEAIARRPSSGSSDLYDVVIVGGGPAGIAASLAAKEKKLRALTLEQETLGGTVAHYPRAKIIMTRPARLPLYGKVRLRRVRKERLLALWQKVIHDTGVDIHNGVRVEHIATHPWGFELTTSAGVCRTHTVLLATGRRGSPQRLGVQGEDLAKVSYRLDDPTLYRGQHVLVVGGGDSALEAAVALSQHATAGVTLCYRGVAFDRAKPVNRRALEHAVQAGKLKVYLSSEIRVIEADRVIIEQSGQMRTARNDAVIVCAGGVLPTALLTALGVHVETKYGTA
jgi:thioredoxin reductase (NADPH)